jgi:hypothetical protein
MVALAEVLVLLHSAVLQVTPPSRIRGALRRARKIIIGPSQPLQKLAVLWYCARLVIPRFCCSPCSPIVPAITKVNRHNQVPYLVLIKVTLNAQQPHRDGLGGTPSSFLKLPRAVLMQLSSTRSDNPLFTTN